MRSEILDTGTFRSHFDDMPDGFKCEALAQIFPGLLTRRKSAPVLILAASVYSSTARFVHGGTRTVWMCFPLPTRSAITQCSSRT
jgi:hypothetical protein